MRSRLACAVLLLVVGAAPSFACPLCYDTHAGNAASQAALRRAILTLLIPPVGIMVGLVGFALRYERKGQISERNEEQVSTAAESIGEE